jgi:hypothetical protein
MNRNAKKFALVAALFVMAYAVFVSAKSTGEADTPPSIVKAKGAVGASLQLARFAADPPDEETIERGKSAWMDVYEVLMSPRCMNCHPSGNRPLQTDESRPHAMNVSRQSTDNALDCATCHREQNSEALGIADGPPGAPNWHLPHKDMPLIFEGRSPRELCEQMKRPGDNAYKSLDALAHHVEEDPLVLWGWEPGGDRTKPPLPHDEFVAAFDAWVASGGACPD